MAIVAALTACGRPADPLPPLGAEPRATSVSGFSSGAYFASQFHLAHSAIVTGAGIVAGGPYGCVESLDNPLIHLPQMKAAQAIQFCMLDLYRMSGLPDPGALAGQARRYADAEKIDPISNLRDDKVYLFTGRKDQKVVTSIVEKADAFYRFIGVPNDAIVFVRDEIDAAHAFVTEDYGARCGEQGPQFMTDCDYDQAGRILNHLLGDLNDPAPQPAGRFQAFDQSEFAGRGRPHGLADTGMVYVPGPCRDASGCKLHVVFHGCRQGEEFLGDVFVKRSGFARWADTNGIIVLFPQIRTGGGNPYGCWDWWGYTGPDYYTKEAPQIIAVRRMIERLTTRAD